MRPFTVSNCAAVIPCYNEVDFIASVVSGTREHAGTVIVVDDGSTDGTGQKAKEAGAVVLRHDINLGKGAALRSGFEKARELGFAWALALDGDGQHAPADIPRFFRCAEETGATMVIGNRMEGADNERQMPWLRRFVNQWMSWRLSAIAGCPLPDTQCGFRLLDLELWSELAGQTDRFEVESELTLSFVQASHRVEFVPITVWYKKERSKIHPLRDTVRWFRWLHRAGE